MCQTYHVNLVVPFKKHCVYDKSVHICGTFLHFVHAVKIICCCIVIVIVLVIVVVIL